MQARSSVFNSEYYAQASVKLLQEEHKKVGWLSGGAALVTAEHARV